MSTISCTYRIYPSWFGGESMTGPMAELACNAASQMGRRPYDIEVIHYGEDRRGQFIDFRVNYSSIGILAGAKQ